jgi:hypothetical protein
MPAGVVEVKNEKTEGKYTTELTALFSFPRLKRGRLLSRFHNLPFTSISKFIISCYSLKAWFFTSTTC